MIKHLSPTTHIQRVHAQIAFENAVTAKSVELGLKDTKIDENFPDLLKSLNSKNLGLSIKHTDNGYEVVVKKVGYAPVEWEVLEQATQKKYPLIGRNWNKQKTAGEAIVHILELAR